MLTLKLAWRSILRHKRRSIITGCAVALSLTMMLFFVGVGDDAHARMAELGIRMGAGHVLVQGKGYQLAQTLDHLVPDPAAVIAAARKLPQVRQAVPRLRASGLLSVGESSAPVMVSGVDPRLEPTVSEIAAPQRRIAGAYLRSRDQIRFANQPADIYVGAELAKTLGLEVGDRTVLILSPVKGTRPVSAAYLVRGIFHSGIDEINQGWVEVPLPALQQQLGLGQQVTQVALHLDDLDSTAPVTAALERTLPGELEVLPWQEALRELYEAIVLDDAGLYLMMAIIFVIMAIGIFNTVLMSVVERTREFGVMMALGTGRWQLFNVVLAEALLLALVAGAIGLGLGLGLHSLMAAHGIDITSLAGDYEFAGIVLEGRIYSRLSTPIVVKWTVVVVGLTVLSALYPAFRSTRLQPVEAFRHV
jgi:ABC-type lipoprotein release transport system permease subunit